MDFMMKPWKYINEGNVHIVLQILGTEYVVRLIKEDGNPVDFKNVKNSVDYVNLIMIPLLLTKNHVLDEILEITSDDLSVLCKQLIKYRPENRRFKSKLCPYAVKSSNLAILSVNCNTNYCIEIKPKEGFISQSFKKYSKCYYCIKQLLKLQDNQISEISGYCPLDLFSGDKHRMKRALISLVENPQNNFKLFIDGNIVYNENGSKTIFNSYIKDMAVFDDSPDLFFEFIIEILLSSVEVYNTNVNRNPPSLTDEEYQGKNRFCCEKNQLKNGCFLQNLLELQKLTKNLSLSFKTDDKEGYEYVQQLLDQMKDQKLDINHKTDRELFLSTTDPKFLALISAVAKDCSVMISFSKTPIEGFSTVQIGQHKIPYKASVTDLEPKQAKTLLKRIKTEKQLIAIYEKCISSVPEIQPHSETRSKQLEAWEQLIADYMKANKQSTLDIRESQNTPLFNNTLLNRKLSQEAILMVLEDMEKKGRAAPMYKDKNVWEIYWHSLDEWGNMIYNWVCNNGFNNTVCTLFELREGETTVDEEFHGLDMNVMLKALKALEKKGKCELMEFDDSQGVKFF